MLVINPKGVCDAQVPVFSTVGRGPKGPKGEPGEVGMPKFSDEEWSIGRSYEALTVVGHDGDSYTAKQDVPVGIEITDTEYWAHTGSFNVQVETYRQETAEALRLAMAAQDDIDSLLPGSAFDSENTVEQAIDRLDSDIDDIDAILPTNAFSTTKTIKSYIDNMALSLRRGVMVVLGDSWSDESNDPSTTWLKTVSDSLGMTAYVTNAKPGTGFVHGGTPIPNQVSGALTKVNAAGYDASDVTLVIAFGGVNDYRHDIAYSAVGSGIRITFTNVRNTFPNAKVLIIAGNTGNWSTMDTLDTLKSSYADYPTWLTYLNNNLHNAAGLGFAYCSDVALWLNGYGPSAYSSIWNNDTLHPAQTGANIIAHHIIDILNGVNGDVFYSKDISYETPTSDPSIETIPLTGKYSMRNGHVHITFFIDTASSVSDLPSSIYWSLSPEFPVICGGSDSKGKKIPISAYNFSGDLEAVRGYYNAGNNRLTIYPPSGQIAQMFGSVDFDLM